MSSYITKTTDESISGIKTFNYPPINLNPAPSSATLGTATISTPALIYTIIVPQGCQYTITLNTPVALQNNGSTVAPPSSTAFSFTLTSISCIVRKNGVQVGTPTVSYNNVLPATKTHNGSGTFQITQYFTNAITTYTIAGTSIGGDTYTFLMDSVKSGSPNVQTLFNGQVSSSVNVNCPPITSHGTGYTALQAFQIPVNGTSSNMLYVGCTFDAPTTMNGKIQVKSETLGKNTDGMGFQASDDTYNIINFANTAGTLRGYIGSTSATSVVYATTSDERLKQNIINMSSQLDNIKKLSPREYSWKETGEKDYGFIAQEVYKIYPHLNPIINNDKYIDKEYPKKLDGSDYLFGLDYSKFTPYLWSGLKEVINKVEKLENNNVNIETNPNVYLLKDVIQQQKDMKTQLSIQDEKLNSMIGQLIINQQQEKIIYLENTILSLQKQLNMINNALISKNIL